MKPFNLERALAGNKVVTREGVEVTEIYKFTTATSQFKIAAVVHGVLKTCTVDGVYSPGVPSQHDLFMAPVKKQIWTNVYKLEPSGERRVLGTFTSKQSAIAYNHHRLAHKKHYRTLVDTVLIHEWEE